MVLPCDKEIWINCLIKSYPCWSIKPKIKITAYLQNLRCGVDELIGLHVERLLPLAQLGEVAQDLGAFLARG